MFYIGDSIRAGQGLLPYDMDTFMLTSYMRSIRPEIGVYDSNYSHSGATIEYVSNVGGSSLDKELPRRSPSIKAQLQRIINDPLTTNEYVDLIVLNGGINDMWIGTFLTPEILPAKHQERLDEITNLAEQYAYGSMKQLLTTAVTSFPNTKFLVTGYYQVISGDSNSLSFITKFISLILAGPIGTVISSVALNHVIIQCKHAANELNANLVKAISETNSENSTNNIVFVDPDYNDSNAIFASNSYLWGFDILGEVDDSLKVHRQDLCNGDWFCEMASVGHPNKQGAIKYFQQLRDAL